MSECNHDFDSNELSNYCAKGCGETWALYTIKTLRKENEELRREIGKPYDKVDRLFEANRKLKEENQKLRGEVEFLNELIEKSKK